MSFSGDRIPSGTGTGTEKFFGTQFPSGAGTEISAENRSGPLNLSGNGTYSGSRTLSGTGACSYPSNLSGNGICFGSRFPYGSGTYCVSGSDSLIGRARTQRASNPQSAQPISLPGSGSSL